MPASLVTPAIHHAAAFLSKCAHTTRRAPPSTTPLSRRSSGIAERCRGDRAGGQRVRQALSRSDFDRRRRSRRVAPELLHGGHALVARAGPPPRVSRGSGGGARHDVGAAALDTFGGLRVEAGRARAVRGRHVQGGRPAAIDRRRTVPARKDVGIRPGARLGLGWLQRRVRHRHRRRTGDDQAIGPGTHSERRLPVGQWREGPDLLPAFQLRALPESAQPRRVLRRRVWRRAHGQATPGHPAPEVLRAILGVVPHAEDALLPLRLVIEPVAGRSGPGRRCRQPDLELQPPCQLGCGHHLAALRPEHRRAVPVLARRGQPPDRRRVLPRVLYLGRVAQGGVPHQGQVHGDDRQQPEHARRERRATR